MLDDGRLTDGQGQTVDFRNTIIVLTSNLGAEYLADSKSEEISDTVRDKVMQAVRRAFRPEFLNRLDDIILFSRLRRADMVHIVDIQVARLAARLSERGIGMSLDNSAREWLAKEGYDPAYGARPLKRVIQRQLQDVLATQLLSGVIADGQSLNISAGRDGLSISPAIKAAKVA